MRTAVIGGTGLVGRHLTAAFRRTGHEVVVVSRSQGIDVLTGAGLDEALTGVNTVVDVTSTPETDAEGAREFFEIATKQLLNAEQRAGVSHHVVLSIVGIDRVRSNGHYAGKRRQEELVQAGPVPFTILRCTQFHEFAEMVVCWTRGGDVATVPPLLVQPIAVNEVVDVLAEIAVGPPKGRAPDLAGPEPEDLVDMARRTLAARGEHAIRIRPSWNVAPFSVEMAGNVLLPGTGARIAPTTFAAWLAAQHAKHTAPDGQTARAYELPAHEGRLTSQLDSISLQGSL